MATNVVRLMNRTMTHLPVSDGRSSRIYGSPISPANLGQVLHVNSKKPLLSEQHAAGGL